MKTKIKITLLFVLLLSGTWIIPFNAHAQGGSVSFQVFYNELSPYGTWVENPDYGYVWIPDVAPGFTPYATNGYWVFTDEGWTWVSNYSWGWAPFHYGRWYADPMYGPIWVPDNEWGPGWVTWRRSAGYYGWAPIGPGISITIAYGNDYFLPSSQWTFVRDRDFGRRNINNYYVNNSRNVTIINNSTVVNNPRVNNSRNVRYNAGPERNEVERHLGKPIVPVTIRESSKPGQNMNRNQLQIYRPQVERTMPTGQKPVPTRVSAIKDVKTPAQRKTEPPSQKGNPAEVRHPLPPVHTGQPAKGQQPTQQQQRQSQPAKQKPSSQPAQQQRQAQPAKQQPPQQQPQQQRQAQPAKQQPPQQQPQQQRQALPAKQQPPQQQPQQQRQAQPSRQQPQQQHQAQPARQQQSPPSQPAQNQKSGDEQHPRK